ncbi:MAG: hypothetical protein ACRYGF_16365 [Janthinobacterium lividum]
MIHARKAARPAVLLTLVATLACRAASAQQPDPQRQLPADQRAYRASMAIADPAQRLTAFRAFSVEYQDSKYFDSVQEAALRLLLRYYPTRTSEIRDQVEVNVANADKGYERWQEESAEADLLADAGVLLPLAQKLAEDSNRNLNETTFLRGMARMYGELQAEMPTPEELHGQYKEARATTLLALAHVYLRQGKRAQAAALLDQAATLQPRNAQAHALRGEIAMAEHHNEVALAELERAQALGELSSGQRTSLLQMYRETHGGSDAGLEEDLDKAYAELNPPAFTPPARKPIKAGHTVLLELFTGSSCLPCVGADSAAETLLNTYGNDAVLLEWDEHVPRPDPLANPSSVERAEGLGVGNTPTFFLDGKRMAVFGGTREGAPEVYAGLTRLVDVQVERPSGVELQLSATLDAKGSIHAQATTATEAIGKLQATVADEIAPWPGDSIAVAEEAHTEAGFPPQLVVNFALVEDDVRYSGENGVRFHRMVVRATSSPAAWGQPLHPGKTDTFLPTFDLSAVQRGLADYLDGFEKSNERFGPVQFLSKPVALQAAKLGVVAWVQDTRTHRVVQAAFARVSAAAVAAP